MQQGKLYVEAEMLHVKPKETSEASDVLPSGSSKETPNELPIKKTVFKAVSATVSDEDGGEVQKGQQLTLESLTIVHPILI